MTTWGMGPSPARLPRPGLPRRVGPERTPEFARRARGASRRTPRPWGVRRGAAGPNTLRPTGRAGRAVSRRQYGSWRELQYAAGHAGQYVLQALEGAEVTLAGRGLLEVEHLCDLDRAQLLEVTQGQDLAVERVQAVERFLQTDLAFSADGGLAWPGVPPQELGGQRGRRRLRH